MDATELQPNLPPQKESGEPDSKQFARLYRRYRTLQSLFITTLCSLVIFTASVGLFIYLQMRTVRAQIYEQRAAMNRRVADFQTKTQPELRAFALALQQFASTNKDFQPIMEKYRPVLSNYISYAGSPGTATQSATRPVAPPR